MSDYVRWGDRWVEVIPLPPESQTISSPALLSLDLSAFPTHTEDVTVYWPDGTRTVIEGATIEEREDGIRVISAGGKNEEATG